MDRAYALQLVHDVFHEGTAVPNGPEQLERIFRDNFVCHGPPGVNHSHTNGPEPVERCLFGAAFSDVVFSITGVEVDGDRIVATFSAKGQQVEPFGGMAAGGERTIQGTATFRVAEGRLAEGWGLLRG